RYHFDAMPQARAHLHAVDNRQLLFFPDPMGRLRERQPVLLELCIGNAEQPANAAGEVTSIEGGIQRGAWLDLIGLSLHQLRSAQRKHPRVGGARLAGAGFAFRPGDLVRLADLQSGPAAAAVVLWSRNGEMALQFDRTQQQTRLGASRLLQSTTARWSDALHAHHPAGCECDANGRLLEP